MPIYESACVNPACRLHGTPVESYYPRFTSPMNRCEHCKGITERVQSTFAVVFTGPISARYLDKSKDGGHKRDGSHWAWENETKPGKGGHATRIETWDDQRSYCRRNGKALPSDMPNNYEVAGDGKTVKNSIGMPGCEV